VDWADELEKRAILGKVMQFGSKLLGRGGAQNAAKGVTTAARNATIGTKATRSAVKASRKQMAAQEMARRSAARAQSQSGAQAALKRRSSALGTNTSRQQSQLKNRLMKKRQAAGQATSLPNPQQGGAVAKKKGFTTGEKVMGGALLGVPAAGGLYLAGQGGGQQRQPGY
jgi:hypothetical protein